MVHVLTLYTMCMFFTLLYQADHNPPSPSRDSPSLASAGKLVTDQQPPLQYPAQDGDAFGTLLQIPQNAMSGIPDHEHPGSQTNLAQSYTPVNTQQLHVPTGEQKYGREYQNEVYEQQHDQHLTTDQTGSNYPSDQQMVGGETYQMGGDYNPLQVNITGSSTALESHDNQGQPVVEATDSSTQFIGESWPGYGGVQNEAYGNSNLLVSNQQTGLTGFGYGEDFSHSNTMQPSVEQTGSDSNDQTNSQQAFTGFGFQTNANPARNMTPSYFTLQPEQSDTAPHTTEAEENVKNENDEPEKEKVQKTKNGMSDILCTCIMYLHC